MATIRMSLPSFLLSKASTHCVLTTSSVSNILSVCSLVERLASVRDAGFTSGATPTCAAFGAPAALESMLKSLSSSGHSPRYLKAHQK